MEPKERITISISKDTLQSMDLYLKEIGLGSNRSGLIEKSIDNYLDSEK